MTTKRSTRWLPLIALLSLILLAGGTTASAQHHGYGGYGHGYNPYYYSGYGHGYSPYYYSAFGPYGYRGLGYGSYREPTTGTLKFQITPKTDTKAQVYINDALASEFKHKRSLNLAPGEYQIEVRKEGYQSQSRTVRVTAGEALQLNFTLVLTAQQSNSGMEPAKSRHRTAEGTLSRESAGPTFLATRLSPSGSKLAIAAWSMEENSGNLQVYDLGKGEQLVLDRPAGTFQTEEEILTLEWTADEKSLAALTKPAFPVTEPPQDTVAGIRALDLQTGGWTTVGRANLSRGPVEVSLVDTLSSTEKAFLLNWINHVRL
ncbi:MAG: carboxypeptidase regulatory-like domain-containing protein [Acidobacteria bacterium]|nr:carboxypeptidase regulatory-like domain-containing protein [Acidobacteriota bacterium]